MSIYTQTAFKKTKSWPRYRRYRNAVILMYIGYIPYMIIVHYLIPSIFSYRWSGFVPFLLWGAIWVYNIRRMSGFRCPRCQLSFFTLGPEFKILGFTYGWGWYRPFTKECVHCGHPKWAEYDGQSPGPNS